MAIFNDSLRTGTPYLMAQAGEGSFPYYCIPRLKSRTHAPAQPPPHSCSSSLNPLALVLTQLPGMAFTHL